MSVLAVGAHPDDVEILAGGTLARFADEGHDVHVCVLTDGSLGADGTPAGPAEPVAEVVARRRAEAEESARVIGATLHWIGEPDGFLFDSPAVRRAMTAVLRRADPQLLLVHSPADYHADHRAAGEIAVNARHLGCSAALAGVAGTATAGPAPVWFMDTLGGAGTEPERWVDVTSTMPRKRTMLSSFRSQNALAVAADGQDYLELVEHQNRSRGLQCGVRYAEAFTVLSSFAATPDSLVDLFGV